MGIMKLFILLLALVLAAQDPVKDASEDRLIIIRRYYRYGGYLYRYRYHRYYYRYHRYHHYYRHHRYLAEKPSASTTELTAPYYRYYRYYRYHRYFYRTYYRYHRYRYYRYRRY